ncbi:MAG: NAD(P)/FAD-dependent oxidoreductase [Coriobacteriales bacterium]
MNFCDVIVVGAGASGLSAAISAAKLGAEVVVLEGDIKPARRVLRTGNGRCNLTNSMISPGKDWKSAYNSPEFVTPILTEFNCDEIRRAFSRIGLLTFEDSEGRVYPITNRARSVVDVMLNECDELGVKIICETEIVEISRLDDGRWAVRADDGRLFGSRSIVLATASPAKLASKLGIPTTEYYPVLGPLRTDTEIVKPMTGVRMRSRVTLEKNDREKISMSGEVLFRKYGVSGIVIFDISRFAEIGDTIVLDLLPFISEEDLVSILKDRVSSFPNSEARYVFDGILVREVADSIMNSCGASSEDLARDLPVQKIAHKLKSLELKVTGGPTPEEAQVCRGGIGLEYVDPETLEVKDQPGLFVCGETLDVDAACGGYNLHWAWSSGIVAGRSAANKLGK